MDQYLEIARQAALSAGEIIQLGSAKLGELKILEKQTNDFVSEIDKHAERCIREIILDNFPSHSFLGEEYGVTTSHETTHKWVVDPLDGTTNFLRSIPHYAVSIACLLNGRLEHAVIVDPVRREEFTASRGRGAQLNGRRIRVSQLGGLEGALLGTGIPFKNHCDEKLVPYSKSIEILAAQSAGIRRAGAASLDLAYVAAGRLDGFWEIGLAPWDIAAGALLVREAGGLVADIDASENYLESGNIVCGSPKCFKTVLQVVKPLLA